MIERQAVGERRRRLGPDVKDRHRHDPGGHRPTRIEGTEQRWHGARNGQLAERPRGGGAHIRVAIAQQACELWQRGLVTGGAQQVGRPRASHWPWAARAPARLVQHSLRVEQPLEHTTVLTPQLGEQPGGQLLQRAPRGAPLDHLVELVWIGLVLSQVAEECGAHRGFHARVPPVAGLAHRLANGGREGEQHEQRRDRHQRGDEA